MLGEVDLFSHVRAPRTYLPRSRPFLAPHMPRPKGEPKRAALPVNTPTHQIFLASKTGCATVVSYPSSLTIYQQAISFQTNSSSPLFLMPVRRLIMKHWPSYFFSLTESIVCLSSSIPDSFRPMLGNKTVGFSRIFSEGYYPRIS